MDYKTQKQKVIKIYKENIRNQFLESWKSYHKEKAKLENLVGDELKRKCYPLKIKKISVKYNPKTDSFNIEMKKSLKEKFKLEFPFSLLKCLYDSSFNLK